MASIRDIFTDKKYIALCRKLAKGTDLADDLLQHCAIRIHEKGICEDKRAEFTLYAYFKRTATNEWKHPSSKFNQLYRRNPTLPLDKQLAKTVIEDDPSDFRRWLDRHISRDTSYNEEVIRRAEAKAQAITAKANRIREQLLANAKTDQEVQEINEAHQQRMQRITEILDKATKPEEEFFMNELFLLYLKLGSIRNVAEAIGIPKTTVFKCIQTYKQQIYDEYRKNGDL